MKARALCIVISSVFSLEQVSAWTHHHRTTPTSHQPLQGLDRHQQSKHFGLYATSSNNYNVDNISSTTSRRQWFGSLISSTAAVVLGSSATARAADLITTAAVCDPGVSVWKRGQRIIYLLGTAHISSASAQLAGDLVRDIHPKGVFVELDAKRITGSGLLAGRVQGASGGMDEDTTTPTSRVIIPNIQVISSASSGTTGALASSPLTTSDSSMAVSTASMNGVAAPSPASVPPPNPIMRAASRAIGNSIKGMYQKLDSAGFQAGEEFVVAIREGQRLGSDIVLGDRDVEVTLRRLTEGLARTDLQALMNPDSELEQSLKELVPSQVASSPTGDIGDLSDAEFRQEFSSFVETMKAKENVRKIMAQLERLAPALYEALVSERDAYMAAGLNGLDELETIVAVMGVAHVDGVERNLAMNGWKSIQPKCGSQRR